MENIIKVNNLSKTYRYNNIFLNAVNDISFNIKKGESVGYIGKNGLGKTTTLRILSGIIHPSEGNVVVDGKVPYLERVNHVKNIGIMFGNKPQLWPELSPNEAFHILRDIYEVEKKLFKQNFEEIVFMLGLEELVNKPLRKMSLGQRIKCEIASIFLHNPSIIFLDEPTIGLDIETKEKIKKFIKFLNSEKNVTVLFTSHDLNDISDVCKRIIIIDSGKIIEDNTTEGIVEKYGKNRIIEFKNLQHETKLEMISIVKKLDSYCKIIYEGKNELHITIRNSKNTSLVLHDLLFDTNIEINFRECSFEDSIYKIFTGKEKSE